MYLYIYIYICLPAGARREDRSRDPERDDDQPAERGLTATLHYVV